MALTVLVVDDDPYTRQLVRRVVAREFEVRILEAEHGVEALEVLMSERVDLMLLDISMPVMNGVETLEALRRTPSFNDLAVMILAGQAEEQHVMRLMELRIAGFLVKPFRPGLLADRIGRLLRQRAAGRESGREMVSPRLRLRRNARVLLADRTPEFCRVFAAELSHLCQVECVQSLPRALALSVESPPSVVFVGDTEHLLETEIFVRKLRLQCASAGTAVIALVPPTGLETARAQGLYDGVAVRSYVPAILRQGLRDLFSEATVAAWLLAADGTCMGAFASAAESLLQEALPSLCRDQARPPWSLEAGRWMVAALEVQAHGLGWDLRLQMPWSAALQLTAARAGLALDEVSEQGVSAGLVLMLEAVAGRLCECAAQEGLTMECGTPRVSTTRMHVSRESRTGGSTQWWFSRPDAPDGLCLGLTSLAA